MVYLTDGELINILKNLEDYHYNPCDDNNDLLQKLSYISGQLTLLKKLLIGEYKECESANE